MCETNATLFSKVFLFQKEPLFVPSLSWQTIVFFPVTKGVFEFCFVHHAVIRLSQRGGQTAEAGVSLAIRLEPEAVDVHVRVEVGHSTSIATCEKKQCVTLFLGAFPTFVPSLSWQSDHSISVKKWGKRPCSYVPRTYRWQGCCRLPLAKEIFSGLSSCMPST